MMISLQDVFEFYYNSIYYGDSFEPNLTWKEILECLQQSDARDFAYATIGSYKKTLLHHHFRSRYITGEDNDEIAVARMLIERSIDMGGSTVQLGGMQEHGDSVLTVSDKRGRTPLHTLFESPSRQHSHVRYVELIIEMSARVDEKRKTSFYWNELMLQQNDWGYTPLHDMAMNTAIEYLAVSAVLKKCNDPWESRCLIHPLLQRDTDGNLPIHLACFKTDANEQRIETFVGFLDSDYKVTYDTVFTYKCLLLMLESFIEDHEEEFEQFWNDNNWWSSEEIQCVSLQQILSSNKQMDDIDWSSLRTPFDDVLPKLRILLEAAAKSNMYHTHQTQEYEISLESVHLAASVPNFPTFILQMMVLHDQSALLRRDEHGRIPLHYALVASAGNQEQDDSCEVSRHTDLAYWSTIDEWTTIDESRSLVQFILANAPSSADIYDGDGRLPIHLAIANNRDLSSVVLPLIAAYPGSISAIDPCTNLKPFLLAASNDNALDLIFRLAALEPNLINDWITAGPESSIFPVVSGGDEALVNGEARLGVVSDEEGAFNENQIDGPSNPGTVDSENEIENQHVEADHYLVWLGVVFILLFFLACRESG
jgi:ankyrin repeat protein